MKRCQFNLYVCNISLGPFKNYVTHL